MYPYLLLFYIILTFLLHVVCNYSTRQSEKECSSASGGRHGLSSATSPRTKGLSHLNEGDQGASPKRCSAKKPKASSPCEDIGAMSCRSKSLLIERDIKIWRLTVARYATNVHDVDRTVHMPRRRYFQPNRFSAFAYSSDEENQADAYFQTAPPPSQSLHFCRQRNKFATSFEPPKASLPGNVPAEVQTSPLISEQEKWRRWNKVIDEVEEARREGRLEEYAAKRREKRTADEPPQRSQVNPADGPSSVLQTKSEDGPAAGAINTRLKESQTTCEVLASAYLPLNPMLEQEAEVQAGIDRLEIEKELALQVEAVLPEAEEEEPHASTIKSGIQNECTDVVADNVTVSTPAATPHEPEPVTSCGTSEAKKGERIEEEKDTDNSPTREQPQIEEAGAYPTPEDEQADEWQAILNEDVSSHFGSPFDEPSELPEVANATPEPAPWPADHPTPQSGGANSATDGPPQGADGSDKTDALTPKGPQEKQSRGDQGDQEEKEQTRREQGGATSANQVEEYDIFNEQVSSNFGSPFDEPSELLAVTSAPDTTPRPVDHPIVPSVSENTTTEIPLQPPQESDETDALAPSIQKENSTARGPQEDVGSSELDVDELAKATEDELAASHDSDMQDVTTPPGPQGEVQDVIAEQTSVLDSESSRMTTCVAEDVNMDSMLETLFDSGMDQDELKALIDLMDGCEKLKMDQDVITQKPDESSVAELYEDMVDVSLPDLFDLGGQSIEMSMAMDDTVNGPLPVLNVSAPEYDDIMSLADTPKASLDTTECSVPMAEEIEMANEGAARANPQATVALPVEPVQESLESETQQNLPRPPLVQAAIPSTSNAVPSVEPVPPTVEKDIPAIIASPTERNSTADSKSTQEMATKELTRNPPQSSREEPTPPVATASRDLPVPTVAPSVHTNSADKAVTPGPVPSSSSHPSIPSAGTSKSVWSKISFVPLQLPNRTPAPIGLSSTSSSSSSTSVPLASTSATTAESMRSHISMEPIIPRVVRTTGGMTIAGKRPTRLAGTSIDATPPQEAAKAIPTTSGGPNTVEKGKGREEIAVPSPSVAPVADADFGDELKKLLLAAETYSKTLQASQADPSVMFSDGNELASRAEVSPSLQVILDELDRIKATTAPDEKCNGDKNDSGFTSIQDTLPCSGDTVLDPSGASIQIHPSLTSDDIRCWYPMMMDENEHYEDRMAAAAMLSGDDAF